MEQQDQQIIEKTILALIMSLEQNGCTLCKEKQEQLIKVLKRSYIIEPGARDKNYISIDSQLEEIARNFFDEEDQKIVISD